MRFNAIYCFTLLLISCAKLPDPLTYCAPENLQKNASDTGVAQVFLPDPINASGNINLSPTSVKLDDFRTSVSLSHLGGRGVLEGQYVEVRNGLACNEWFGAYDLRNQFSYSHSDPHFQESMAYYLGDQYRTRLDQLGYLRPFDPVRIVAHCMLDDNAFFTKERDPSGAVISKVCLGDSLATPGAFYGDDGIVTVHELQHATTADLYGAGQVNQSLNQYWYDEAGALNEGISDFMGLMDTLPMLSATLDPREFSRWALDRFYPRDKGTRGAHRCPEYDSTFAAGCSGFPSFSSDSNQVSYIYPDGLGWPYANNYSGADLVRSAYRTGRSQEEIHNAGILLEGALWDVYEALKVSHDSAVAQELAMKLVLEGLRHLPKPSTVSLSPVTFRRFANSIVSSTTLLGFSNSDQAAVSQALTERGLLGGPSLTAGWAQRGDGVSVSPGLRIEDNPSRLKSWLSAMGSDPKLVTQGIETGLNSQLDPGDVAAIWFDLKNISSASAGGVQLTITSPDSDIAFLDGKTNAGPVSSSQVQIQYSKINGTGITAALNGSHFPTGTGNSYFLTNPFYSQNWQTAVWVKVAPQAAHGKSVTLTVEALPSNGEATQVAFPVMIH